MATGYVYLIGVTTNSPKQAKCPKTNKNKVVFAESPWSSTSLRFIRGGRRQILAVQTFLSFFPWLLLLTILMTLRIAISRLLHRLFYSWAFIPFIGDLFARMALTAPPVLVVSLPRSGSSWLGSMLGLSSKCSILERTDQCFFSLIWRPRNA